ncbi:MAG: glycosyltransferase family 4 protein [Actinobacteria bacterium]|nr:glycosyltransferase family 4 protein [Actinomycetota bacterium]
MAKPDWGIEGGFEILLGRVVTHLEASGHSVSLLSVPGAPPDHVIAGKEIDDAEWADAPDVYSYESLLDRFSQVDASAFDLVITTQPASWAVEHPRKLAIFYHHHRVFYDLADKFASINGVDREQYDEACQRVWSFDRKYVPSISQFLAPSRTVADRLVNYWNVAPEIITQFHAGPISGVTSRRGEAATDKRSTAHRSEILCVSRNEFTKRTEMFVAAAHCGFGAPATLVGSGGQLGAVRRWAAEKAAGLDVAARPWERSGTQERVEVVVPSDPVNIVGRLSDDELLRRYENAKCLVAPAYNEDYGLTALEAFTHGVPVVVCSDGGGLAEFVDDGVNGLVAEPEPEAIAAAVRSITASESLADSLSAGALATAAEFTWERAHSQLDDALAATVNAS